MMDIFKEFQDWTVNIAVRTIEEGDDGTGNWIRTTTDGDPIPVLLYNRSAAQRTFSVTWAEDVSDVAVVDDLSGIDNNSLIVYNGIVYDVDSVVNVGEQSSIWAIGLRVHK